MQVAPLLPHLLLLLSLTPASATTNITTAASHIPSASSLGSRWQNASPLLQLPLAQNFFGAAALAQDMAGLKQLAFAPFIGNIPGNTSYLRVDGVEIAINQTRGCACEAQRRSDPTSTTSPLVTNSLRLPFEQNAVLQVWTLAPPAAPSPPTTTAATSATTTTTTATHTVELQLAAPMVSRCDLVPHALNCGWGTALPADPALFAMSVDPSDHSVVVSHRLSNATARLLFWASPAPSAPPPPAPTITATHHVNVQLQVPPNGSVWMAWVFGSSDADVHAEATALRANASAVFEAACSRWEERWQQVFTPNNGHYSGHLPTLVADDAPEMVTFYYASALALVSLERTNLPFFPRSYTISQGSPSSYAEDHSMGNAGAFTWDLSFVANTYSMLDPAATKASLVFILANTDFSRTPFLVPQLWDLFSRESYPQSTPYMFDYLAAHLFFTSYIATSGDEAFLDQTVQPLGAPPLSVRSYLLKLALAFQQYPPVGPGSLLADYGGNLRCFLEVIPTYIHSLPALQFGNAYMLRTTAALPGVANATGLLALAAGIETQARAQMYAGDGVWQCLYPNQTRAAVRTICDYVYISLTQGVLANRSAPAMAAATRGPWASIGPAMADFAWHELLVQARPGGGGWFRALSPKDALVNASADNLLLLRSDWGLPGSYPALASMALEALLAQDGSFDRAYPALKMLAAITAKGALAQGLAVETPPAWVRLGYAGNTSLPEPPYPPRWPEFFEDGSSWPDTLRTVANVGAGFAEAIVRSFFGWQPQLTGQPSPLGDQLYLPLIPRPFRAQLLNVPRSGGRLVRLEADDNGVDASYM